MQVVAWGRHGTIPLPCMRPTVFELQIDSTVSRRYRVFCGKISFRKGEHCESTCNGKFLLRDLWDSWPGIYACITRLYQLG